MFGVLAASLTYRVDRGLIFPLTLQGDLCWNILAPIEACKCTSRTALQVAPAVLTVTVLCTWNVAYAKPSAQLFTQHW